MEEVDQIEEIDSRPPVQKSEDKEQSIEESKAEDRPEDLERIPKEIPSNAPQDSSITPMARQRKETILQKFIKRIPKIKTPKVHSDDSPSGEEIPPPLPTNYPSTEQFLQRVEYRKQKHQFSAQKVEYYLRQAEQGNINVDEIVMKSSLGMTFVERR